MAALGLSLMLGCAGADTPQGDAGGPGGGDAGSGEECIPGARRCVGNSAQVCTGGSAWSLPQNCGSATCIEGSCQVSCAQACMPGETRCAPEGLQQCESGADGCGVWSAPQACVEGQRCVDGACADPGCDAQCTPGETRCVGPAVSTCQDPECPQWGEPIGCVEGQVCASGACTDDPGMCEDECEVGERVCLGPDQEQRCERQDSGCLDFSPAVACAEGRRCAPGEGCVAACSAPECQVGETRCFQGGVQRCVETPEEGCVIWGAVIACDAGAQCQAGMCAAACVPECVVGEQRCTEGGRQTCQRVDDCERWGAEEQCPAGTQCQGEGQCGVCSDGDFEERPCGNCGSQSRRCNSDGTWGNWAACGGEGRCAPGTQRDCGNCGRETCSNQCQWGGCQGAGVCAPGELGAEGSCAECGRAICNNLCQWGDLCDTDDGRVWQRCNDCGWQYCSPQGRWFPCARPAENNFACGGGLMCSATGLCE